ncbi:MAG: indolepyruvate oxidoreductase subunit beta [Eubacteriales bacterium]|nr:indolepyruvate oxidoreductase subunit beta [Eubacteriales bacterium]
MNQAISLNIALVGVGGQGTLVAGKLLGTVATILGLEVKVSEVHGMSQRGGSVITYVRMAEHVASPIIEPAEADFVLAFEELEALRWAYLLKAGGSMMVNTMQTLPASVAIGAAAYPQDIIEALDSKTIGNSHVFAVDAQKLADEAGSYKATNIVMLGAMSRLTPIDEKVFTQAIDRVFPEKFRAINHKAFQSGSDIIKYTCEF